MQDVRTVRAAIDRYAAGMTISWTRAALLASIAVSSLACGRSEASSHAQQAKACARLLGADIERDADGGEVSFQCVVPILSVQSLAGSLEYYVEVLGFAEDWTWCTASI